MAGFQGLDRRRRCEAGKLGRAWMGMSLFVMRQEVWNMCTVEYDVILYYRSF